MYTMQIKKTIHFLFELFSIIKIKESNEMRFQKKRIQSLEV